METYIALLRGINVSGQKKIKMDELRVHLATLGFTNLQTYIQSGNIVFQAEIQPRKDLETLISAKIQEKYGFEVPVRVRTQAELQQIHSSNLFPEVPETEYNKLFVAFLDREPGQADIDRLAAMDFPTEVYSLSGETLYYHCKNGAGKARLTNNLIESKLKVSATSRNWKTIEKLLTLAGS